MLETIDYLKQYGNTEKKAKNINYKAKCEEQKHEVIIILFSASLGTVSKFHFQH